MKLIECVPNFSEGLDESIISQITNEICSINGVTLLDVDPGKDTNRTVVTFIGKPDQVIEAAFLAIKKASVLIDMRNHRGEHPRMGATDVCPIIPVSNITIDEDEFINLGIDTNKKYINAVDKQPLDLEVEKACAES